MSYRNTRDLTREERQKQREQTQFEATAKRLAAQERDASSLLFHAEAHLCNETAEKRIRCLQEALRGNVDILPLKVDYQAQLLCHFFQDLKFSDAQTEGLARKAYEEVVKEARMLDLPGFSQKNSFSTSDDALPTPIINPLDLSAFMNYVAKHNRWKASKEILFSSWIYFIKLLEELRHYESMEVVLESERVGNEALHHGFALQAHCCDATAERRIAGFRAEVGRPERTQRSVALELDYEAQIQCLLREGLKGSLNAEHAAVLQQARALGLPSFIGDATYSGVLRPTITHADLVK